LAPEINLVQAKVDNIPGTQPVYDQSLPSHSGKKKIKSGFINDIENLSEKDINETTTLRDNREYPKKLCDTEYYWNGDEA
jgi:hypothetical protein